MMSRFYDNRGNYFLCARSEVRSLMSQAEKERDIILNELKAFFTGDIGINIYAVQHVMGWSIAGELTVNGEVCRTEDPVVLIFLDLNELK